MSPQIQAESSLKASQANQLNQLLADQYILMNKTVDFLLHMSSTPPVKMVEIIYDQLRVNVNLITDYLKKHSYTVNISIENFLNNTRLQTAAKDNGHAATFESLIADHYYVAGELDADMNGQTNADVQLMETFSFIKIRHEQMAATLRSHLNQKFNLEN